MKLSKMSNDEQKVPGWVAIPIVILLLNVVFAIWVIWGAKPSSDHGWRAWVVNTFNTVGVLYAILFTVSAAAIIAAFAYFYGKSLYARRRKDGGSSEMKSP